MFSTLTFEPWSGGSNVPGLEERIRNQGLFYPAAPESERKPALRVNLGWA